MDAEQDRKTADARRDRKVRRDALLEFEAMIDAAFSDTAGATAGATADNMANSTADNIANNAANNAANSAASLTPAAAPRTILVDGFNVLHATLDAEARAAGWWRRVWREDLLRRVAGWPHAADQIWVAFDGAEPAWSVWAEPVAHLVGRPVSNPVSSPVSERVGPHVHSVYVESADDWIVRRARRATRPATTIVVSRDRQVAGRARSAGCEVWSPGALLERCPLPVTRGSGA